jgi:hypothetical protein
VVGQDELLETARANLEDHGIEVGEPDQIIHRQDDSERPKAVYTHRFDRLDIYNADDSEETVIQIEHELLHRYQYSQYSENNLSQGSPTAGMDLQRPSAAGSGGPGNSNGGGLEDPTDGMAPTPVESTDQIIETLGEAFALVYTAFRRDELDTETVASTVESLRSRGDYKGRKTAAMLEELYERFEALEEPDRMESFLTTLQDEYMG